MKVLTTKEAIEINYGLNQKSLTKVSMELGSIGYFDSFTRIGVNYTYKNDDEEVLKTDAYHIDSAEEINELFEMISPNLPAFENEVQATEAKFLEGAKYIMAQTFGISVDEIEIVEKVFPENDEVSVPIDVPIEENINPQIEE